MDVDLALQSKALHNKIRRLNYQLHILRGVNDYHINQQPYSAF